MHFASLSAARRFFAGLTEYAFLGRLGVADPRLVDYITELLIRFIHVDELYGVRSPTGRRLHQVVDMLSEAQAREGLARRAVHRHIGDYTLFWTGVYPEAIDRLHKMGVKDSLIDYRAQGKRAYHIASTLPADREDAEPALLRRLSDNFEMCAYGLGEVRRQWEREPGDGGAAAQLWLD